MKKLIIPLLLTTVLLGGCHRVTVRHQMHLPPAVEVVEDLHIHHREVVVQSHQGWQPPGHRREHYSHQGPDRVVVVRPQPVSKPRVTSRHHSVHVVPPPAHGHAPLPRVTERITRHRVANSPLHRESSRERQKRTSPQESYRQRREARDNPVNSHTDSRGGEDKGRRAGRTGNNRQGHNGRDNAERADRRKSQRGSGSQQVAKNKGKKDGAKENRERQQGEENERGRARGH